MADFFTRYRENKCSEEDFEQSVDLLISSSKKSLLNEKMKDHWEETTSEGDFPDLKSKLHEIHYNINLSEKTEKNSISLLHYFSRIAAILFIPLVIALSHLAIEYYSVDFQTQSITCPLASHTSFELPDGSKVWLNAGSTLTFPNKFQKYKRMVSLKGQAFFEVKKGKVPFAVHTDQFQVDVLGTRFDVSVYENENARVTLERGSVNIKTNNEVKSLVPGEQALLDNKSGKIQTAKVNVGLYTSWKDDLLIFDDEPFSTAIYRLERWFNIQIVVRDPVINTLHLTGTFSNESIHEIIDLIEITNPLTHDYEKENRTLTLKLK